VIVRGEQRAPCRFTAAKTRRKLSSSGLNRESNFAAHDTARDSLHVKLCTCKWGLRVGAAPIRYSLGRATTTERITIEMTRELSPSASNAIVNRDDEDKPETHELYPGLVTR
jgi:hypothetical protein